MTGSIKEAQTVLRSAQNSKVQLATDTIAETGKRFVDATKSNPGAWDAVVAFLNYRTYLNSITVPMPPQLQNVTALTSYKIPAENGRIGVMKTSGVSKYPDVAQFRLITASDLNAQLGVGPSYILLESSDIKLDGLYVQRMIFINSHISYRGGPVSLDNVYFLNCTFDIDRRPNGQELTKKMLAGPITNFMVG